jgi:hypothetical protein
VGKKPIALPRPVVKAITSKATWISSSATVRVRFG